MYSPQLNGFETFCLPITRYDFSPIGNTCVSVSYFFFLLKVIDLLETIFKEFDASKRKVMMEEVQKIYTDEVPVMPLYMRADVAVIPANLKGFKMPGHQFHSTLNIDTWSLDSSGQGH